MMKSCIEKEIVREVMKQECVISLDEFGEQVHVTMNVEAMRCERIIVTTERERIIREAVRAAWEEPGREKPRAAKEIVQMLERTYDFRCKKNVERRITTKSLTTQVHAIMAEMREEEEEKRKNNKKRKSRFRSF